MRSLGLFAFEFLFCQAHMEVILIDECIRAFQGYRLREKESAFHKYITMKLKSFGQALVQTAWICFSLNRAVLTHLLMFCFDHCILIFLLFC